MYLTRETPHGYRTVSLHYHGNSIAIGTSVQAYGMEVGESIVSTSVELTNDEARQLILDMAPKLGIAAFPQPVEVCANGGNGRGLAVPDAARKATREERKAGWIASTPKEETK